jgi:hypothetical protein
MKARHVQGGDRNRKSAVAAEHRSIPLFCRVPAGLRGGVARLKSFAAFVEKRWQDLLICKVERVMSSLTRSPRGRQRAA